MRQTADLSMVLDQLITQMKHVKAAAGLDIGSSEDTDIFSVNARTLLAKKTWWDSRLASERANSGTVGMDETMDEGSLDFLDDTWLQDFLGTGSNMFNPFTQY